MELLFFLLMYVALQILNDQSFGGLHSKGEGGNSDEFKSGGLHEKHAVATWNLGTISAFA
jgi:hypothetical protein